MPSLRFLTRARIIGVALLALSSGLVPSAPALAAAPSPGGPGALEKVVFVHYPRGQAAKPPNAGGGGSTSTCPDPSTCSDNKWSGVHWATTSLTVLLDSSGSGVSSGVSSAVTSAFAAWDSHTTNAPSINVTSGSTSCSTAGTTTNGVNQVCWRDLTSSYPGAIAVTFVWYYRSNKTIAEADTIFNNGQGFTWSYTDPGLCTTYTSCNSDTGAAGRYDVRNIATHEFGHFLALFGDLYSARDQNLTMYGYGSTGELKKDSLGYGDCLGITKAYGGSC